jgi:hypothetical protein
MLPLSGGDEDSRLMSQEHISLPDSDPAVSLQTT